MKSTIHSPHYTYISKREYEELMVELEFMKKGKK